MTISVKLTEHGSVLTIYNPKKRIYFFRPLHLDELDLLCQYGEEASLPILLKQITNKSFNGRAYE